MSEGDLERLRTALSDIRATLTTRPNLAPWIRDVLAHQASLLPAHIEAEERKIREKNEEPPLRRARSDGSFDYTPVDLERE
jgi:hypothetical protein